ncbi:MAG: hypothetical protein HZB38_17205 [Planctomycetes bacterium]|nr:hypothetical protein [Planctomycetota bacterium]
MRILILQILPDVRRKPAPRFEAQLGTLLSLLGQRGHELSLVGLTRVELSTLKTAVAPCLPQLIYADIHAVCAAVARRSLQYIQEHEFLPVVVGGSLATLDPAACLSLPGVQAAAIGEPDASLVTYLERVKDPAVGQVVYGVWLRDESGLARPQLPSLVEDLDSLPLAERDLFDYAAHVRRTGEIEIAVGRGCPQRCAYCVNRTVERLYADRGMWVRRRSPENVLDEIRGLRDRYAGASSVRFLPFRCHLRANQIDEPLCRRLAQAGCRVADIEVISASDLIRNDVFAMDLSNQQVAAAFAALRAADIRTRAIVYLGAPYESEASLDELIALLHRVKPDLVDARAYYPWPGTGAMKLAHQNGWLHPRGEEQYHTDQCGIDMPACRPAVVAAALKRLRGEFPAEAGDPWWRRWTQSLGQVFQRKS